MAVCTASADDRSALTFGLKSSCDSVQKEREATTVEDFARVRMLELSATATN